MTLHSALIDALPKSVSTTAFQAVICRLLSYGAICRDDSDAERDAYDVAVRALVPIDEYLGLAGYRLVHVEDHLTFLLFPPGSSIPGQPDDEQDVFRGPRLRPSVNVVAYGLALKLLYLEAFQNGQLNPNAEVDVSYETLLTTLQTQIHREPPKLESDQLETMRFLKSYKIIRTKSMSGGLSPDMLVIIRPLITWLVPEYGLPGINVGPTP